MVYENKTRQRILWCIASIVVVGVYAGLFAFFIFSRTPPSGVMGQPEAIMLEFAEEPEAPHVEQESETIQMASAQEKQPEEPEQVEETPPEKVEPVIETPKSDMQEEVIKPEPEKPKVEKKEPPKEKPKKTQKKQKPRPKPDEGKQANTTQKSSGPQIDAKRGATYAAPQNSRTDGTNGRAVATWLSKVQQRIAKAARNITASSRYVDNLAQVTFTYDESGHITSAKVLRSSGNNDVDAKALQAVKNASPLPAPPTGQSGSLGVPVRIGRR